MPLAGDKTCGILRAIAPSKRNLRWPPKPIWWGWKPHSFPLNLGSFLHAKALKVKNRLAGRLAKVQADIQAYSNRPVNYTSGQ
jgi:hypothetical protein